MKIALVFTNDWELFGDGSGDYYEVQHNPTLDMLDLLKSFDAKMTFFAEVMQQLTMKNHEKEKGFESNITKDWEKILQKSISESHDVQLHIHPQWLEAKLVNNEWKLNDNKWVLGDLDPQIINKLISDGKDYLESFLKNVDQEYSCNIFRAGAYYIEPSQNVLPYLVKNSFNTDSSITRGLQVDGKYNYNDVPSNVIPWNVGDLITQAVKDYTGFIEMPIYSNQIIRSELLEKFLPFIGYSLFFGERPSLEELRWIKKRDKIKAVRYPVTRRPYKKHSKKNFKWYLSKILSRSHLQLDYDYIPASIFVELLHKILDDRNNWDLFDKGVILPIIASGHIKDAHTNENLRWILEKVEKYRPDITYMTMSEISKIWHNKKK